MGIHSVHIRSDSVLFRLVEIQEDVRSEIRIVDEICVAAFVPDYDLVEQDQFGVPPGKVVMAEANRNCTNHHDRGDETRRRIHSANFSVIPPQPQPRQTRQIQRHPFPENDPGGRNDSEVHQRNGRQQQ